MRLVHGDPNSQEAHAKATYTTRPDALPSQQTISTQNRITQTLAVGLSAKGPAKDLPRKTVCRSRLLPLLLPPVHHLYNSPPPPLLSLNDFHPSPPSPSRLSLPPLAANPSVQIEKIAATTVAGTLPLLPIPPTGHLLLENPGLQPFQENPAAAAGAGAAARKGGEGAAGVPLSGLPEESDPAGKGAMALVVLPGRPLPHAKDRLVCRGAVGRWAVVHSGPRFRAGRLHVAPSVVGPASGVRL